ncbi:hypothetical protein FK529_03135 [Tsukamurella asaccharolytica]|uniref:Uncharacterized protein n=1 Tax=Tsukamurella asaccharolytica TaxID=2592067 RepID=A0A5C5RC38_9ACTN|nr:hypothetical protein [Tsukamurella asaccharolytica]TWS20366.1 hypothetical protein FK529_03135 [Tsukamurella asaccharolytica]
MLPDSFKFLREVIREHALVAPVSLIKEGRETNYGLLYLIQGPDSTSDADSGIACFGFPNVSRKEIETSRFGTRLPQDVQDFYRLVHGAFQIVIQSHGDMIVPVDEIRTWSERTGIFAPDEFEHGKFESILEGAEYVPDPGKMAVVWEAGLSAVAVDLDRPEECWDYAGGVLNYIPRVGSSGFVNTPSTTIDLAVLSFLGYYPGIDRY